MKKDSRSGMTLIEVMVSVAIFSLSIIAFTMLFSHRLEIQFVCF